LRPGSDYRLSIFQPLPDLESWPHHESHRIKQDERQGGVPSDLKQMKRPEKADILMIVPNVHKF
jgi:hypothetical protein